MHLIIMGAPGSGKGTYAKVLKGIFAVPHISTGEMFRKAISEGTELGKLAQSLIDKGNFVPDEITNELVKQRIAEEDCKNGFLLDGYPRNLNQAYAFTEILKELNIDLDAVINLNVADEEIIKRTENTGALTGIDTGFERLNKLTNGLQPGEFIILAARPAVGKTAFALNLAKNCSQISGKKVACKECSV